MGKCPFCRFFKSFEEFWNKFKLLFQLVVISFNSFQKQHLPPKNNYSFNLDQFLFAQFIFFVYFCHEKMANDRASFRKNAYLCSNIFHTMPVAANSAH